MLSYHDLSMNKFEGRPQPNWDYGPYMPWIFGASALANVVLSIRSIPIAMSRHYALPLYYRPLLMPAFSIVSVIVFGLASWTSWKRHRAAVDWGVAASFLYFVTFLRPFILHLHVVWYLH